MRREGNQLKQYNCPQSSGFNHGGAQGLAK